MTEQHGKNHVGGLESVSPTALQRIDFHGDAISTVQDEQSGKVYCVPKEMSEQLGVSWSSQLAKLKHNPLFHGAYMLAKVKSLGGFQDTVLLAIDMLPAWLLTINANQMNEEGIPKLLALQKHICEVLASQVHDMFKDVSVREDSLSVQARSVYFIHEENSRRVKIGMTINLDARLQRLRRLSCVPLRVLEVLTVRRARHCEKLLHAYWHACRDSGEWFVVPLSHTLRNFVLESQEVLHAYLLPRPQHPLSEASA